MLSVSTLNAIIFNFLLCSSNFYNFFAIRPLVLIEDSLIQNIVMVPKGVQGIVMLLLFEYIKAELLIRFEIGRIRPVHPDPNPTNIYPDPNPTKLPGSDQYIRIRIQTIYPDPNPLNILRSESDQYIPESESDPIYPDPKQELCY